MLGNTQLLNPTDKSDHDFSKSSSCVIVRGKKRARGLQGEKKAKNNGALVEIKGKEEEDDPCSLEVGEKNLRVPSRSKGTLLAQEKGKKF